MIESEFVSPWNDESEERIASTLDLKAELARVQPNSFEEYSLCFEAALDKDRPISDRERFLLSRYGREYALSPEKFNQKLDEIEARMAQNVGEFVLLQTSPTLVFIDRLSSPELTYFARIGGQGFPYMGVAIETSSSIGTVIDDDFNIVPELTRDFVDIETSHRLIEEGSTRLNWIYSRGEAHLDPENSSFHEGDEWVVRFGIKEIMSWQSDNPRWAEHVDNMMGAWNTKLINYPVAQTKLESPFGESSLRQIQ
ncbi:MAG: hypothetical protein WD992_03750 [Candidatus Levyibacteriota bacterium]